VVDELTSLFQWKVASMTGVAVSVLDPAVVRQRHGSGLAEGTTTFVVPRGRGAWPGGGWISVIR
jgi:hypothetical protein